MEEKKAAALVLFVVSILGAVSLLVILSGQTLNTGQITVENGKIIVDTREPACDLPSTLEEALERDKNEEHPRGYHEPYYTETCPRFVQSACKYHYAGSCLRECFEKGRTMCKDAQLPVHITAQVVLSPEECKRLAKSYDVTTANFLSMVGAASQTTPVINPCTGATEQSIAKVYSAIAPVKAYARNVFQNGDVTGYTVNEEDKQIPVAYTLCQDKRSQINEEGNNRCSSL